MRILMVIALRNFRDEELLVPKRLFESKGWTVTIASRAKSGEQAEGMLGARVKIDLDIAQAQAKDYDAVVFVGGTGAAAYFNDPTAHMLAWQAYDSGKVVGAICIAPSILANANVLQGKRATAWPSERENIASKSAEYTGADVEVSGRVVTGKAPSSAKKFAEAIAKLLEQK
ncbi:MAG: DJ-1/PfpI family protein [Candidatus Aenigmatarchaeota archaeon]